MCSTNFQRYHVRLRHFVAAELMTRTYTIVATDLMAAEEEAQRRWYCEGLGNEAMLANITEESL